MRHNNSAGRFALGISLILTVVSADTAQSDIVQICQPGAPGYWDCMAKNPDKNGVVGNVKNGDGVFIGGPGVISGLPQDPAEPPTIDPIPPPLTPVQPVADKRMGHHQLHCCQTSGKERICVDWHWAFIGQSGDDINIVGSSLFAPMRLGSASEPPHDLGTSFKHNPPLRSCYPNGCPADKDMWVIFKTSGDVTAAGYNYAGHFFWECGASATTNPGSVH